MKNLLLPSPKLSWIFLTFFFIFDNFFSYYAVTQLHASEGNLVIAPLVERYPFLYFLCIPATILIVFFISKTMKIAVIRLFKKRGLKDDKSEKIIERIILGTLVIYWVIGNSSINLSFLLGHRLSIHNWALTSVVGIVTAFTYFSSMLHRIPLHKKSKIRQINQKSLY